jgi:hypothetical protein
MQMRIRNLEANPSLQGSTWAILAFEKANQLLGGLPTNKRIINVAILE